MRKVGILNPDYDGTVSVWARELCRVNQHTKLYCAAGNVNWVARITTNRETDWVGPHSKTLQCHQTPAPVKE